MEMGERGRVRRRGGERREKEGKRGGGGRRERGKRGEKGEKAEKGERGEIAQARVAGGVFFPQSLSLPPPWYIHAIYASCLPVSHSILVRCCGFKLLEFR